MILTEGAIGRSQGVCDGACLNSGRFGWEEGATQYPPDGAYFVEGDSPVDMGRETFERLQSAHPFARPGPQQFACHRAIHLCSYTHHNLHLRPG